MSTMPPSPGLAGALPAALPCSLDRAAMSCGGGAGCLHVEALWLGRRGLPDAVAAMMLVHVA